MISFSTLIRVASNKSTRWLTKRFKIWRILLRILKIRARISKIKNTWQSHHTSKMTRTQETCSDSMIQSLILNRPISKITDLRAKEITNLPLLWTLELVSYKIIRSIEIL